MKLHPLNVRADILPTDFGQVSGQQKTICWSCLLIPSFVLTQNLASQNSKLQLP